MYVNEEATKIKINGQPISKSGYYVMEVTTSNGFKFKIPCRGYSLASQMFFQNTLKYSTYTVEMITEKQYKDLQK